MLREKGASSLTAFIFSFHIVVTYSLKVFNIRKGIAEAIIGLLLVFSWTQRGLVRFYWVFYNPRIGLYWGTVFSRLEEERLF